MQVLLTAGTSNQQRPTADQQLELIGHHHEETYTARKMMLLFAHPL
jgi:hypothetical protein